MAKSIVFTEINPENGKIIRIFKNTHNALVYPQEIIKQSLKKYAVGEIRSQIVERSKIDGMPTCEACGRSLPGEISGYGLKGHMNEIHAKGKLIDGQHGEVSLLNSVLYCPPCHVGPDGQHGDRYWQKSRLE